MNQGAKFQLDLANKTPGDEHRVGFIYPEIYKIVSIGDRLLLDDGKIILQVEKLDNNAIATIVEVGGILANNKGVNIPDITIPHHKLSTKDENDLLFALKLKPDFIALCFVQNKDDIILLKEKLKKLGYKKDMQIIAKIETKAGLKNIDEIAKISDILMVARGDLSDNISPENL